MRWQAATGSDPVREGTRKRGREGLWKEGRRTRESDISAYLQRRGTDRDTTMKVTQMGGGSGSTNANAHADADDAERASIGLLDRIPNRILQINLIISTWALYLYVQLNPFNRIS